MIVTSMNKQIKHGKCDHVTIQYAAAFKNIFAIWNKQVNPDLLQCEALNVDNYLVSLTNII